MTQLIDKSTVVAEIKRRKEKCDIFYDIAFSNNAEFAKIAIEEQKRQHDSLLSFIDTLEVKDPYEQCVQYDSIKAGIQAHAETYSFNIESELFNQLTKEQQKLWRKEIEQACISGGEAGAELARDQRYKENLEVKELDFHKELLSYYRHTNDSGSEIALAKHFFELGLKAQKGK